MTRSSSILILVLALLGAAIAAGPAGASDGYGSINSIVGGGSTDPRLTDASTINALIGADSTERSPVTSASRDPTTLNAVLATGPEGHHVSPGPATDYRSVNALVGDGESQQPSPLPVVEVRPADGFDWFDALTGALVASGLMLITLATARSVARRRHPVAESRA
jgi:hypothetical protein